MKLSPAIIGTILFIIVAAGTMFLADSFLFDGKTKRPPPTRVVPDNGEAYFDSPLVEEMQTVPETPPVVEEPVDVPVQEPEEKPVEKPVEESGIEKPEAPVIAAPLPLPPNMVPPVKGATAKIAIIIDDVGMDAKRSRMVAELPAPITLAFLPYGTITKSLAKSAKEKGHHIIIHTPMEAMNGSANIGPGGLVSGMDHAAFENAFGLMADSFAGYEGINNHMGSRLTQDQDAMARLMQILKARGLYFVDSKTIDTSVAARQAAAAGIPYAERDVFLDHQDTAAFVAAALAKTEAVAKRRGYAIAIGHPKDHTINGLKAWIPTLKAKGIELVPVKDILTVPKADAAPVPVQAAVIEAPEAADVKTPEKFTPDLSLPTPQIWLPEPPEQSPVP